MNTSHTKEITIEAVPIQDRVRRETERLETNFSRIDTTIHRFPQGLRGIGGPGERYIIPSVVALGPYHHGRQELQEMEEVKHAAAYYFCAQSGHPVEEVYAKILSIVDQARSCYEKDAAAHYNDAKFADMMFLDGCFLLMYICTEGSVQDPPLLTNSMVLSMGPCMLRDILLLENQLPWLVLEALLTFKHVQVQEFLVDTVRDFMDVSDRPEEVFVVNEDYRAPHLLGLARLYMTGSMPQDEEALPVSYFNTATMSAIHLAEIGIHITASKTTWFANMSLSRSGCLLGDELSMSPVFLNDFTACWLVNMAAFEARISTRYPMDGFLVSSYLSLLALLMDKEEDVQKLRAHHIVNGLLSNQEMLDFFKTIARHLRLGYRFFALLEAIEGYKTERRVWIMVHRFLYLHWKTIVTLISIASVLVGIFRALFSLKYH
ncbi:hypothetical protein SETIT_3G081800v2 [Setaria italica]|uniref:Uncharacterized protein n=1 Tax=Setaria italica TaxID=4555 RepID=K3ZCM4_SETIT|nr:UPF0481 protein At3g47200 [Setaria italica]RCV15737.1 hypothetical protein SETIT_3G081800v2 [Setaria italica]